MTVARGRRRRALFTALAARLGDLERYGLLALVAALLLGVASLAQALGGSPAPIRAMTFQGVPVTNAESASTAPVAALAAPDAPVGSEPLAEPAGPAEPSMQSLAEFEVAAAPAAAASRAGFDFFEPPIRLPGQPAVSAPPPPLPGSAAQGASEVRRVKIQRGDTLQKIAARELGSAQRWQTLLQWNPGLDPRKLPTGGLLLIKTERRAPVAAVRSSLRQHEVAKNDTLQSIAQRYLGDRSRWIDLLEANRDQLRDPTRLRAGMKIRIP